MPLAAGLMLAAGAVLVGIWMYVGSDAEPAPVEQQPDEQAPAALPFDTVDALSDEREFVMILRFTRGWDSSAARALLLLRSEAIRKFALTSLAAAYPEAAGRSLVLRIESEARLDEATSRLLEKLKARLAADSIALSEVHAARSPAMREAATRVNLPPEADFTCDENGEWWLVVVQDAVDAAAAARIDGCRRHIKFHGLDYAVRLCCARRPGKAELVTLQRLRDTLKGDGIDFTVELVAPESDELLDLD
ncbi:MAG: hypothetical protein ACYTGN_01590 [Planctomycetota bacterium]|jgi:hypothetical protein